jgi:hypothetical protein
MKHFMFNYSVFIFLFLLLTGCGLKDNSDSLLIINKNSESFEKGLKINGKKEGYWVVFDTNFSLKYDCVYKSDSLNGPVTFYNYHSISCIGEMKANKRNGKWIFYHNYPKPYLEAFYKMDSLISSHECQDY